jgi:uncharacterized membrane protein
MDPATFFLIASLLVGILYCITIPYGAGFDEERHLARIYQMSKYHFLPNVAKAQMHEVVADLSYQRRLIQTPAFDMFSKENFWIRFSEFGKIRYGIRLQSIYSPIIFLPQALIGRLLWWKYDFPILPTILLQRIAGLLIYIAGGYAAIRVIPYGKWGLAALALFPSALFQASTLNADGFTSAASFAFIGWVIFVYMNESAGIMPRSIWILAALSIWLGLSKPGAIVLLPLLLILIKHPFPSKKWVIALGAGALLAVIANFGWWMLASQGSVFSGGGEQSISRQSSMILSDPSSFLKSLLHGIVLTFPDQVRGWTAAYGYWAGKVPTPVYFFSVSFLLAAFFAEPRSKRIPSITRIFLAGIFLFCCTAIYSIVFEANYATGGDLAMAKHGRYYIPFVPLLFLGFVGLFDVSENLQRLMKSIAIISFLLVTVFYSFGIYTTYYTYCGYDATIGGTCTLPIYKNLEKEGGPSAGINNAEHAIQTFTNQCGELEMVQVYVRAIPESSDGSLRFSLSDENHQTLATRDFSIRDIIAENYLSLPVLLPPNYKNKNFEINLESINLRPLEQFEFAGVPGDYYPGQLTVNRLLRQGDLIIHYTCANP